MTYDRMARIWIDVTYDGDITFSRFKLVFIYITNVHEHDLISKSRIVISDINGEGITMYLCLLLIYGVLGSIVYGDNTIDFTSYFISKSIWSNKKTY